MSIDLKTEKDKKKFLGIGFGHRDKERSKSLSPKVKEEVKVAIEAESAKSSKTDADINASARPKSATLNKNVVVEELRAMSQAQESTPALPPKPTVVDTRIDRLSRDELKKVYQELIAELRGQVEAKSERKKQIAHIRQTLKMKPSLFSYVGLQEEIDKLAKTNSSLQRQIDAILKPTQPTALTKQPSNERGRSKSLVPYLDRPVDAEPETEIENDEAVAESIAALEAVHLEELTEKAIKEKFEVGRKLLKAQIIATKASDEEISNLQEALKMKPSLQSIMQLQSRATQLKEHNKLLEEKLEQYKANPPPPEPVEASPAPVPSPAEPTPKISLSINNKPTSFDTPLDDIPNQLLVTALGARYLIAADSNGKSDPYAVLKIGNWKAKTKVIKKTLEPQWHQSFRMDLREPEKQTLEVEVWDADVVGKHTPLGTATYALKDLPKGKEVCVWLKLNDVETGEVNVSLKALDWGKDESETLEKKASWNLQQTIDFVKDIDEKKLTISKLEKQIAELQKQLEAKDASLSDLAREKAQQESLIKQLQAEADIQKETASAQVSAFEVEASLRAELEQLKNSVVDKAKSAEELETKVNGLQSKITELESEKANLKSQQENELNGRTKLEEQLKDDMEAKAALQTQLEANTTKMAQLEDQIKALSATGNAGSAALQEANRHNEELNQENASLTAKLTQLQRTSDKEIAELKAQLSSKETQAQQLQQRLDDIQKALEAKPATKEVDIDALQKELAVLKSVNQNEKSKAENLTTENAGLRKQLNELSEQHKALTAQSHILEETTETLQQQVKELTKLQNQVKDKDSTQTEQAKKLEVEFKKLKEILQEKETQIRMRWKPDYDAHSCISCNTAFSLLTRRHHCRNCGDIFCGTCSSKKSPTSKSVDPVRVCDRCFADILNSKA